MGNNGPRLAQKPLRWFIELRIRTRSPSQNGTTFRRPFFFLCLLEDMAASMSLSSAVADPAVGGLRQPPDRWLPGSISLTWVGAGAGWACINVWLQFVGIGGHVGLQFVGILGRWRGRSAQSRGTQTRCPQTIRTGCVRPWGRGARTRPNNLYARGG